MKNIIFLPLSILIISINCKDLGPGFDFPDSKYPVKLNMEWEYITTMTVGYYDSLGNIINYDTVFTANVISRITGVNDTIGVYNNLIRFEAFDLSFPNIKQTFWYWNTNSNFSIIAYHNAGIAPWVLPKQSNSKTIFTLNELKSFIGKPGLIEILCTEATSLDSILFYEPPRKALEYPLFAGRKWVEINSTDFYRERYVDSMVDINFDGKQIPCYLIKVNWPNSGNASINDYINMNYGLLKREIIIDSIMVTSFTNPDSGGFAKFSELSDLIRFAE